MTPFTKFGSRLLNTIQEPSEIFPFLMSSARTYDYEVIIHKFTILEKIVLLNAKQIKPGQTG